MKLATDANISIAQQQSHHHISPSLNHCIKHNPHAAHLTAPRANRQHTLIQTHSCIIAAVQIPFIIAFHTIQVASHCTNTCLPSATINIRYRIDLAECPERERESKVTMQQNLMITSLCSDFPPPSWVWCHRRVRAEHANVFFCHTRAKGSEGDQSLM